MSDSHWSLLDRYRERLVSRAEYLKERPMTTDKIEPALSAEEWARFIDEQIVSDPSVPPGMIIAKQGGRIIGAIYKGVVFGTEDINRLQRESYLPPEGP